MILFAISFHIAIWLGWSCRGGVHIGLVTPQVAGATRRKNRVMPHAKRGLASTIVSGIDNGIYNSGRFTFGFPPSCLGNWSELDCARLGVGCSQPSHISTTGIRIRIACSVVQ